MSIIKTITDNTVYLFDPDTGYTVIGSKVKTYAGGYAWEITKGNMKDNSISSKVTVFTKEEAVKCLEVSP